MPSPVQTPPRLQMRQVEKTFGGTRALKGVSLELQAGEVHALIGENGAGKSTLMKILSGACRADGGSLELDGKPFVPGNPLHARREGVSMIYQELNLAPHLTVEENIFLGMEPSLFGWIKGRNLRANAASVLKELHLDYIPINLPVAELSIAEKQMVEIARSLLGQPRVLVMDEPTSSLTRKDAEHLFKIIRKLKQRNVSIIYISHFLEECKEVADRFTVLRDGQTVGTGDMKQASLSNIIRMMVGRELNEVYPRVPHSIGEPILEVKGVTSQKGKPIKADLVVHEGQILGIAGLVGAGRTELLRALFGLDRISEGTIQIPWMNPPERTHSSPHQRWLDGFGMLSENRKEEGLMLNKDLADNLTLTRLDHLSSFGLIARKKQRDVASQWMSRLDVRARAPEQVISELSGGNQQKIALGRLLYHDARILLLDEPTRGIDVASKSQIYRLLGELAAKAKGIVFVSSYIPELLGVCDSLAVMSRGALSEVRPVAEWDEQKVMSFAVSGRWEFSS